MSDIATMRRGRFLEHAMLIEFSVKNFRSIKDTQTLSMVASADKELPDNTVPLSQQDASVKRWKNTRLLKSAVIYGANASGKSNLLAALGYLCHQLGKTEVLSIAHSYVYSKAQAFKLDAEWKTAPSEFRITFTLGGDGAVYEYFVQIQLEKSIVLEERLDYYPKGRQKRLFHRTSNPDLESAATIAFPGNTLKGVRGLSEKTAPDALFVSVAAAFNQPLLVKIRSWFAGIKPVTFNFSSFIPNDYAAVLDQEPLLKKRMIAWLNAADLGIKDIRIKDREVRYVPTMMDDEGKREIKTGTVKDLIFLHKGIAEEFISYGQESSGTQRWVNLFLFTYKAIANGSLVFIDEISSDLHPRLAESFMELFHNPRFNPNNAQLICTTHHISLLAADILRRDQIWFAEKDDEGASHYYSLLDYRPRKDKAFMKGYLSGEYGAVPNIGGIDSLLEKMEV